MSRTLFTLAAAVTLTTLSACGGGGSTPEQGSKDAARSLHQNDQAAFEGPVPRAVCGPGSQPELGVQGRVSKDEVDSGRSKQGYWCNLEPVSRQGNGALWQMAWYDDCAYYGLGVAFSNGSTTGFVNGAPVVPAGGVAVVDVSDPENPVQTLTLNTPAMVDPWESLKVNDRRGLLAASSISIEGPGAFDVYDVKDGLATDCSRPVLMSSLPVNHIGHEGEFAHDGDTFYGSALIAPTVTPIDVSDPYVPVPLGVINDGIHGLSTSNDGMRLYGAENAGPEAGTNGLEIWDVSGFQTRSISAGSYAQAPKVVGSVYWRDGATAQMTIPVTIKGKPYVIFVDEMGNPVEEGQPESPGMARIIDISDERNPFVVSKLKNEINMLEHAALREEDGGASGFTYQGHYCSVPQREEPGVVACSYFWQGIRVFDIRDPYHPKEIAYIIPPLDEDDDGRAHASSQIRFIPERAEIWFTNQNTGFHVARFTNGVWPFSK